jgi:hypothetical protein
LTATCLWKSLWNRNPPFFTSPCSDQLVGDNNAGACLY